MYATFMASISRLVLEAMTSISVSSSVPRPCGVGKSQQDRGGEREEDMQGTEDTGQRTQRTVPFFNFQHQQEGRVHFK